MKKIFWVTLFGAGAAVLGGCPIYSDNGGGPCGGNYNSASCNGYCNSDFDCANGYTCSTNNVCVAPTSDAGSSSCSKQSDCATGQNCGADGHCHAGDCSNSGCPTGSICKLSGGVLTCVGGPSSDAGGGDSGFSGCHNDSECSSVVGAKCLNGTCVPPANQCTDGTQCPPGEACVSGVCTPTCSATNPCPTGYTCDKNGVCTGNATPCGSGGTACPANLTCVDQHCVTPCGANGTCPTPLVCVDGGCIPNQIPNFVCQTDGQAGDGKANDCAVGSTCLHHNCYIACDMDAGANACKTADKYNVCTQVTEGSGTYSVCGSGSNLGNQCDPTRGIQCSSTSQVCIDGYCK